MSVGKSRKPFIVFICVSNAKKSPLAEAIMRLKAGTEVEVYSAGTKPEKTVDETFVKVATEIGADMSGMSVNGIDPEMLAKADRVVVLSAAADFPTDNIAPGKLERWGIDEPRERGIEGIERVRLIRDDIELHVNQLITDLREDFSQE